MWRTIVISCIALLVASTARRAFAAWPPGPEAGFTADVYPSAVDAARGLAPRLEGLAREALGGRAPRKVHVSGDADPAVVDALAEAMRRSFGEGANVVTSPATRPSEGVVHVRPHVRRDPLPHPPADAGTLTVTIYTVDGDRECAAQYDEKPWLTDLDGYKAARPGRWVIGQADAPSATAAEASKQAVAYAVAEIMPLIAHEAGPGPDMAFAAQRVSAALASGRFVADRFACRFERPYGNVYHEAILVDASPANVRAIAAEATALRKQTVRSTLGTVGSIGGLVASIGLIYLVTNWLTKGYFEGRLRVLAFVALVVGVVLVFAVLGLLPRSSIRMDAPRPVVVN